MMWWNSVWHDLSARPLCNPPTQELPRRAWPAIKNWSLSRYFIKIDEFPDPINAAIFSTSKVVSFYERNKKNKKIVCLHPMFSHFLTIAKSKKRRLRSCNQRLAAFLFFTSAYAAFALATIALKASGWFIAKSAKTLRLISIPALCRAPISLE